jgi:hypothetical protein
LVDANTSLQQAARAKFAVASAMFLKGWDDYSAIVLANRQAYESAALKYQTANPVATKKYAAGFESGAPQDRAYYLGRSVSDDLLISKLATGDLKNASSAARFLTFIDNTGAVLAAGGAVAIAVGATQTPPVGSFAVIVSTMVITGVAANITDAHTFPQTGVLDMIVLSTMGI